MHSYDYDILHIRNYKNTTVTVTLATCAVQLYYI